MKTNNEQIEEKSLDARIALIYTNVEKLVRHFKLDRRSKNSSDDPDVVENPDEESEKLLREIRESIDEIKKVADRKEFTIEQIDKLEKMLNTVANAIAKKQSEHHEELKSSLERIGQALETLKAEKQDSVVQHHHRHAIEVASSKVFISMVAMGLVIFVSVVLHIYQLDRIRASRDNDLKYRYVKMRGAATPGGIEVLETIFTYNRNPDSIKLIRRQVVQYERLVKEQAEKIEQARLNASEAERLQNQAETVKEGK